MTSITFDVRRISNGLLVHTGGRPTRTDPLAQTPEVITYYPDPEAVSLGVRELINETLFALPTDA